VGSTDGSSIDVPLSADHESFCARIERVCDILIV